MRNRRGIPKMTEGLLYRVIYKSQSGNYQWYKKEAWMVYIGDDRDGNPLFSLRPLAGTQQLDIENLLEAYEMPSSSKPKMPVSLGRYEG